MEEMHLEADQNKKRKKGAQRLQKLTDYFTEKQPRPPTHSQDGADLAAARARLSSTADPGCKNMENLSFNDPSDSSPEGSPSTRSPVKTKPRKGDNPRASEQVEKVMPNDTFYFTILRNPVSQMESYFSYYYKTFKHFQQAKHLEEFVSNTSAFYKPQNTLQIAKNFMAFDLGLDPNGLYTTKNIQITQQMINTIFDPVLITEYFDESLILLKDALSWSFDDILSFPMNSRNKSSKEVMSLETQAKIKSWNSLDWQLYSYFNNSFWKRVEKFGKERMEDEVKQLRMKRAKIAAVCLEGKVGSVYIKDKALKPYQPVGPLIFGYSLKSDVPTAYKLLCQRLVTQELHYSDMLHKMQKDKQAAEKVNTDTNPNKLKVHK